MDLVERATQYVENWFSTSKIKVDLITALTVLIYYGITGKSINQVFREALLYYTSTCLS